MLNVMKTDFRECYVIFPLILYVTLSLDPLTVP